MEPLNLHLYHLHHLAALLKGRGYLLWAPLPLGVLAPHWCLWPLPSPGTPVKKKYSYLSLGPKESVPFPRPGLISRVPLPCKVNPRCSQTLPPSFHQVPGPVPKPVSMTGLSSSFRAKGRPLQSLLQHPEQTLPLFGTWYRHLTLTQHPG